MNSTNPLLSVCMITYNHSAFIKQAVESVMMQQTNFLIELVIGDDCSTDGTKEIIEDLKNQYPDKIVLLPNEKNIGMLPNFVRTLQSTKGKYVAILEGDDFWTDINKLSKQVTFLEENPDFAVCFHRVNQFEVETGNSKISENVKEETTILDLAKGNYIPTPSCVYRNHLIKEFPEAFFKGSVGDYFLHMLNAQFGKIKFLPDVMATYRIHPQGVWGMKSTAYRLSHWIKVLDILISHFDGDVKTILLNTQADCILHLASEVKKTQEEEIFLNIYPNLPKSFFQALQKYDDMGKKGKLFKIKRLYKKILGK